MDRQISQRIAMAATGGLAGLAFFGLGQIHDYNLLPERAALALTGFTLVFFVAVLGMAGPLSLRRSVLTALPLAMVVGLGLAWASLGYVSADQMFDTPAVILAALALTFLPQPFLVAAQLSHWRDYRLLFIEAWTIVIRYAAAWLFVGIVWAVLFLSDALLKTVGIGFLGDLISTPFISPVITGIALGLGIAVVDEMADVMSPYLILRLLRLLLPVLLLVVVLFLVVLPVQGLDGLFGALSAAATLLTIAATGATLVTSAVDQSDEEAARARLVRWAARAMAVLIIAPAALGAWAVWLRVAQYGWTPERVLGAVIAGFGLGYGVLYAIAALRLGGWMARLRQANIVMALLIIAVSAALLTPLLNPERIATRSQLARLENGRVPVARFDLGALRDWGRPGRDAVEMLRLRAAEPGQEALAELFRRKPATVPALPEDAAALREELATLLPMRPATATALRDRVLSELAAPELADWRQTCLQDLPGEGGTACLMIAGDFWPHIAGDEAMVLLLRDGRLLDVTGFGWPDGLSERRYVTPLRGVLPEGAAAVALMRQLAEGTPEFVPVPLNALRLGEGELPLLP
ncbi:DUF4153 domain-containing protein [Gemmobacter sp. LW-1]|uniref:DUF4153 domain-containing protein n=1 Tax=Gemmobacter sp. LW-1 TaxID=1529005 RepID=UPI0006C74DF2|nr:DUF4153 domain-containing protein [Gemmobacter sp. LW-1]